MSRRTKWLAIACAAASLGVGLRIATTWDQADTLQEKVGEYRKITPDKLRSAVGRLSDLPKPVRHFFDVAEDYSELPEPGPNDWLANHPEDGQTYLQFIRGEPNVPSNARHKIFLLPVGEFKDVSAADQDLLREFTSSFFMLDATWLPAIEIDESRMPFKVHEDGRRQLYCEDALRELINHVPDDAFCMLAVTFEDLVPHGQWNFVFGQASFRDRVGIFSFLRFDPKFHGIPSDDSSEIQIARRRCVVLAHEIGHMFGIKHSIYYHCLMSGSNSLAESDAAPMHLCPVCLRKLYRSVGFDVAERENRLAGVLTKLGLENEAAWHRRRLERNTVESPGQ